MCTVLVGCMVGSSVDVWQEMHPEDLRSASAWDWPGNELFCHPFCGAADAVRGCSATISKSKEDKTHTNTKNPPNAPRFVGAQHRCARATNVSHAIRPCSLRSRLMSSASERKLYGTEKRKKCPARVNVFEPLPRLQHGSPAGENDVFTQWRTVFNAHPKVLANRMADGGLEKQKLQRLGAFEPEKIEVCK